MSENENERLIVTSIKLNPRYNQNIYTAINDEHIYMFKSTDKINLLDVIYYDKDSGKINLSDEKVGEEYYKKVISELISKLDTVEITEPHIKKMEADLRKASVQVLKSVLSGAPMIVRFHMDGDGATGAIALYKTFKKIGELFNIERFNIGWNPNRGISYDLSIYNSDQYYLNNFKTVEKPLIFLTDFGTSPDSEPAINSTKSDIIWIEHHPIYEGFPSDKVHMYINPWMYGMDSNVTAGFLTAEFASIMSGEFYKDLEGASLISDHSNFADLNDMTANHLATVLDALTVSEYYGPNHYRISPAYLSRIIDNKEQFEYVLNQALFELKESLDIGVRKAKKYTLDDNVIVYVVDYKYIAERDYEYMKHGRYTTKLHDKLELETKNGNVTMVYFKNYISIRISDSIVNRINLLKIIKELEDEKLICNGGGHNEAGSIKIKDGDGEMEKIISTLISKFNQEKSSEN